MFEAIYLCAWLSYGLSCVALASKLDAEGYKILNTETKAEQVVNLAKTIIVMLVPGYNLVVGLTALFKFDEMYKRTKERLIEQNKLITKEEYEKQQQEKKPVKINLQTKEMNKTRNYSDLSNEEKLILLEEEKQRLLREKEVGKNEETKPYNSRGAYSKRR